MVNKEAIIEKLWRNNWLNIRKATESAKTRNPYKMYVGIELANTVLDSTGNLYQYASATWNYIKTGNHFSVIVSSYYDDEYIYNFLKVFNLKCDYINSNPDFQTSSKPFVDCYIDEIGRASCRERV